MGQDAGLGEPARHRLARHHPHPALHRPDQGEVDQSRAQHPRRAQGRRRGGARSRPRAVGGRHDDGDVGGDGLRPQGPRRPVRGAQHHPHRRDRLFRVAGGGGGLHRHRHERVGPDDGLSRHAGACGVVQSDRVRGAAPERPAVSARLLDRRRRQRQDHGRRRPRRENSRRLGPRQGRPRHHRSEGRRDAAAARRRQGRGAVVHDRVPDQPVAVAAAHRAGPGELGDRRRSVPQRLGDRHRHRRLRRPGAFRRRGRAARHRDRGARPRRRRRQDHAARRARRCDPRRARGLGHSHPEGHVATYRQGRAGGRRHAAQVSG